MSDLTSNPMPGRLRLPGIFSTIFFVAFIALFAWGLSKTEFSFSRIIEGVGPVGQVLAEMFPPAARDWDSFGRLNHALFVTFQMALVGCVFGIIISLPLAWMAAWNVKPHSILYVLSRGLITFCRTVPDLVWALFFVIWVGLGPFAGMLAIMVDTIGFCGRFFAESMEESERGPQESLAAMGAGNLSITACSVLPASLPSMTNTSLFALEKAVRSSVILGIVGAGGIGVELKVAFDMFQYQTAALIILMIFIMVLAMEQISTRLRRRIMQ